MLVFATTIVHAACTVTALEVLPLHQVGQQFQEYVSDADP
jgi:hypothetical protein